MTASNRGVLAAVLALAVFGVHAAAGTAGDDAGRAESGARENERVRDVSEGGDPTNTEAADGDMQDDFEISPGWPVGHYARIETYAGRIVARLLPEQAPQSVAHFAAMAEGKLAWSDPVTGERKQFRYYDGIPIHHVRAGLLFETGDWTTTTKGAPRLFVPPEGFGPVNFSSAGCIGMARVNRNISAVQFFVTAAANPRFNNVFPCFAKVVEGIEVAFQISGIKAYDNGRPLELPVVESIHIFKIGDPVPLPVPRQIPQKRAVPQLREDIVDP